MGKKIIVNILSILIVAGIIAMIIWTYSYNKKIENTAPKQQPASINSTQESNKLQEPNFYDYGTAPEFNGITNWINSKPLKISDQKNKITLINFWTYSNINSINSLSKINEWYQRYADNGLSVIGIHTPQYNFEKQTNNVTEAINRYKILYPVALDNNYKTWSAYQNQFWPAFYLINSDNKIVYSYFGDDNFDQIEEAIKILLNLSDTKFTLNPSPESKANSTLSFGTLLLGKNFANTEAATNNEQSYFFPDKINDNKFGIEGKWKFNDEFISTTSDYAKIKINITASQAFLVASSDKRVVVKISIDGKSSKALSIQDSSLYQILDEETPEKHIIEIEVNSPDVKLSSLTYS